MTIEKKSSSSDALYMTDDLQGRLDPASLVEIPTPGVEPRVEPVTPLYDHSDEPSTGIPTTVEFCFTHDRGKFEVDCTLQLVSFGSDGWRINVDGVDSKICVKITQSIAKYGHYALCDVNVHGIARLQDKIDVTIHFGGVNGTCSVSIAADTASAI